MPIDISVPDLAEMKPTITVFGVGGGGCNAVNNMINSNLGGVQFVVANTDAQALAKSPCERKIQMGVNITEGLGAGAQPEIGAAAAEEALGEISDHLAGAHMVFITAGMGGGTGTGAAPVIARRARELGILTVGVVTKPFDFEGRRRMEIAERGIEELTRHVDTLIVIPNQNLFRVANEMTSFTAAFAMADQVLHSGVASITELMTKEGLINLDFADVRAVMSDMGKAMMGTGEASGENRAEESALSAISNPLLDIESMAGARGVLISIAGGPDLTLYEVDQAASRIREEVDPDANIIVGATIEEELEGTMRVSVVATGLQAEAAALTPRREESAAIAPEKGVVSPPPGFGGCIYPAPGTENHSSRKKERSSSGERSSVREPGGVAKEPPLRGADDAGLGDEQMMMEELVSVDDIPHAGEVQDESRVRPRETRPHTPAPPAPPIRPATQQGADPFLADSESSHMRIPPVEEFPEPWQEMIEEKRRQISGIAESTRTRRGWLKNKVKVLFGRGQSAPGEAKRETTRPAPEKRPQAPGMPRSLASAGAGAAAGLAEEDDPYSIPAFLRRK